MGSIIRLKEDIPSDFDGTVFDIETIGEFDPLFRNYNDSRRCHNIKQVILGFINRHGLRVFCANGAQAITELESLSLQLLDKLERPFYAFNADFESSVWFHQLGKVVLFDGELNEYKMERKAEAVTKLAIDNYGDPFHD